MMQDEPISLELQQARREIAHLTVDLAAYRGEEDWEQVTQAWRDETGDHPPCGCYRAQCLGDRLDWVETYRDELVKWLLPKDLSSTSIMQMPSREAS